MIKSEGHRTLLVDNSNTRTKFTLLADGEFDHNIASLPTRELSEAAIRSMLAERQWQYDDVMLCSVVPTAAEVITWAVGGNVRMLHAHSPMNIQLDYPLVSTLGADRIANVMAAASLASAPCVVVDFGTAVTFDVLLPPLPDSELPRFVGGVIAPGLAALGQYLARNTALLPALTPERPAHAIGRSTEEALHSGAFYGYCGMVRGILHSLAEEMETAPQIIATGGDAAMLGEWLPEISCVSPLLTFRGLALAAELSC